MLSLNSLRKDDIEKAKEDFVNYVFSYMAVKIIKTKLTLGKLPSKNDKNKLVKKKKMLDSLSAEIVKFSSVNQTIVNLIPHFGYKEKLNFALSESSYTFLKNNLYLIISLPLAELMSPGKMFCNFSKLASCDQHDVLRFFSYKELRDGYESREGEIIYSLYNLGETLKIRTCPYCNKNYIITIRDNKLGLSGTGKLINASFDHWFPQSESSIFQTSFYNLIPSCSNCNSSIKHKKQFTLDTHIHPYTAPADLTKKFKFNYFMDEKDTPIVYIDYLGDDELNKKLRKTFADFKTEIIYNAQMIELKDMIELAEEYGEDYINTLQNAFPEVDLSKEKIYNILFNTSEIDDNHHHRPLSKFRFDILKKLEIIK